MAVAAAEQHVASVSAAPASLAAAAAGGGGGSSSRDAVVEYNALLCLARQHEERGASAQALQARESLLLAAKAAYGDGSPELAAACAAFVERCNRAAMDALRTAGRTDECFTLLRKAEILTDMHGAMRGSPAARLRARAATFNNLGLFYRARRQHDAALSHLEQALEIEEGSGPAFSENPAATLLNLCSVLSSLGRHRTALAHARRALAALAADRSRRGGGGALLAAAYHAVGCQHEGLKAYRSAAEAYASAVGAARTTGSPNPEYQRAYTAAAGKAQAAAGGGGGGGTAGALPRLPPESKEHRACRLRAAAASTVPTRQTRPPSVATTAAATAPLLPSSSTTRPTVHSAPAHRPQPPAHMLPSGDSFAVPQPPPPQQQQQQAHLVGYGGRPRSAPLHQQPHQVVGGGGGSGPLVRSAMDAYHAIAEAGPGGGGGGHHHHHHHVRPSTASSSSPHPTPPQHALHHHHRPHTPYNRSGSSNSGSGYVTGCSPVDPTTQPQHRRQHQHQLQQRPAGSAGSAGSAARKAYAVVYRPASNIGDTLPHKYQQGFAELNRLSKALLHAYDNEVTAGGGGGGSDEEEAGDEGDHRHQQHQQHHQQPPQHARRGPLSSATTTTTTTTPLQQRPSATTLPPASTTPQPPGTAAGGRRTAAAAAQRPRSARGPGRRGGGAGGGTSAAPPATATVPTATRGATPTTDSESAASRTKEAAASSSPTPAAATATPASPTTPLERSSRSNPGLDAAVASVMQAVATAKAPAAVTATTTDEAEKVAAAAAEAAAATPAEEDEVAARKAEDGGGGDEDGRLAPDGSSPGSAVLPPQEDEEEGGCEATDEFSTGSDVCGGEGETDSDGLAATGDETSPGSSPHEDGCGGSLSLEASAVEAAGDVVAAAAAAAAPLLSPKPAAAAEDAAAVAASAPLEPSPQHAPAAPAVPSSVSQTSVVAADPPEVKNAPPPPPPPPPSSSLPPTAAEAGSPPAAAAAAAAARTSTAMPPKDVISKVVSLGVELEALQTRLAASMRAGRVRSRAERELERQRRVDAALSIQRTWRGAQGKRRWAAEKLFEDHARRCREAEAARREASSLRIQCCFRAYAARERVDRTREERRDRVMRCLNRSVALVQGYGRARSAGMLCEQRRAERRERCARRIQAFWRGHDARTMFGLFKAEFAEKRKVIQFGSATRIQAWWRKILQRRRVDEQYKNDWAV